MAGRRKIFGSVGVSLKIPVQRLFHFAQDLVMDNNGRKKARKGLFLPIFLPF